MTWQQKLIAWIGALVICTMGLFPPWTDFLSVRGSYFEHPGRYSWILKPPPRRVFNVALQSKSGLVSALPNYPYYINASLFKALENFHRRPPISGFFMGGTKDEKKVRRMEKELEQAFRKDETRPASKQALPLYDLSPRPQTGVRIDMSRLVVQWICVLVLTLAGIFSFSKKP